jgi:hypothetical protein
MACYRDSFTFFYDILKIIINSISLLLRVGMTYKIGFGLYDWIYYTLYIHTTQDYRQYSAIADLHISQFTAAHAIGFSIFTSPILTTDL